MGSIGLSDTITSLLEIDQQTTGSEDVVNHSVTAVQTNLQSMMGHMQWVQQ